MAAKKATVTLSDVATAARVSKATASNVFSRPERVRPVLRERVEEAARLLGYSGPDPKGRMLSSGKVNAIGLVPHASFGISILFKGPFARLVATGVAEVCEEHGVGLSLVSGREDQEAWGIRTALVDGFILNSAEQIAFIAPAKRKQMPVVLMYVDGGPAVSSVRTADRDGARQVTEHLLALGHRRFVVGMILDVFGPPVFHAPGANRTFVGPMAAMPERLAAIDEALRAAGLSLDAMPIVEACTGTLEEVDFASSAALLLDRAPEATAVIALGDKLALAVLDKARERGLVVPRDLSVASFDDLPEAAVAEPPLTTVALDPREIGRTAARLLLDGGPPRQVVLPVKLVVRESTGAVPTR
jgi:DNA-binding LacI/PurR family transcriptional regulator